MSFVIRKTASTGAGFPASTLSTSGTSETAESEVLVCVGDDHLSAAVGRPLVFGRADLVTTAGIGPDGAGSVGPRATNRRRRPRPPASSAWTPRTWASRARALAIEFDQGVWWLANLSGKRNLLLDAGYGSAMITLRPAQRHAIAVWPLGVLVPGAIYTHRIDIHVPKEALAVRRPSELGASGTITAEDLHLTDSRPPGAGGGVLPPAAGMAPARRPSPQLPGGRRPARPRVDGHRGPQAFRTGPAAPR